MKPVNFLVREKKEKDSVSLMYLLVPIVITVVLLSFDYYNLRSEEDRLVSSVEELESVEVEAEAVEIEDSGQGAVEFINTFTQENNDRNTRLLSIVENSISSTDNNLYITDILVEDDGIEITGIALEEYMIEEFLVAIDDPMIRLISLEYVDGHYSFLLGGGDGEGI